MSEQQRILLDTHVWIWLLEEVGNLSHATITRIDRSAKERRRYFALWKRRLSKDINGLVIVLACIHKCYER